MVKILTLFSTKKIKDQHQCQAFDIVSLCGVATTTAEEKEIHIHTHHAISLSGCQYSGIMCQTWVEI